MSVEAPYREQDVLIKNLQKKKGDSANRISRETFSVTFDMIASTHAN